MKSDSGKKNLTISELWERMENELREKDPHDDWPGKGIVMTSPWNLEVHSYHEGFEEHETQLDFVRQKAIRPEDFDESSLPPELLAILKEDGYESYYPNVISAPVSGQTLEEAIEKMRVKLRLLDHGYILMDEYFYENEILDDDNGAWMKEDEEEEEEDW